MKKWDYSETIGACDLKLIDLDVMYGVGERICNNVDVITYG